MSHDEDQREQGSEPQHEDLELGDDRAVNVAGGDTAPPSRPSFKEFTVTKTTDVATPKLME
jgi:type VI protein secretion system component Hcp